MFFAFGFLLLLSRFQAFSPKYLWIQQTYRNLYVIRPVDNSYLNTVSLILGRFSIIKYKLLLKKFNKSRKKLKIWTVPRTSTGKIAKSLYSCGEILTSTILHHLVIRPGTESETTHVIYRCCGSSLCCKYTKKNFKKKNHSPVFLLLYKFFNKET